jgi:hypothetical protein
VLFVYIVDIVCSKQLKKCQQYKQEALGQHTRSKQAKNVNNINKKH